MSKMKKERVLFDEDEEIDAKMKKSRVDVIFKSGLTNKVRLENFTSVFKLDGVNMYDDGRNSLLSSAMYNEIKTLMHMERNKTNLKLSKED